MNKDALRPKPDPAEVERTKQQLSKLMVRRKSHQAAIVTIDGRIAKSTRRLQNLGIDPSTLTPYIVNNQAVAC